MTPFPVNFLTKKSTWSCRESLGYRPWHTLGPFSGGVPCIHEVLTDSEGSPGTRNCTGGRGAKGEKDGAWGAVGA